MKRRFLTALEFLLVAALPLTGAPLVDAVMQPSSPETAHCADLQPGSTHSGSSGQTDPCPCCPEGSADMASCSSICMATPAVTASLGFAIPRIIDPAPRAEIDGDLVTLADPPLKPPPIV